MENYNGNDTNNSEDAKVERTVSAKEFLNLCLSRWKWFLISIVVFLGIGMLFILRSQPKYVRTISVLIKNNQGGGSSDISNAFSSMGLVSGNTNVNNELLTLMSPALMAEVVDRLDLEMNIVKKGTFHGTVLYGTTAPFRVAFPNLEQQQSGGFRMTMRPDGTATLTNFYKSSPSGPVKYKDEVELPKGFVTARTPIGTVLFSPNTKYEGGPVTEETVYYVSRSGQQSAVESYSDKVSGDLADKEADIIDLTIKDVNVERAIDVLNTMMLVYNLNYVNDKNRVASATSSFIDERLRLIEQELGTVDSDISDYKSQTLVPDLAEAAKLNMKSTQDLNDMILNTNNQLSMATYVKDYVANPANTHSVIPVNTGVGSGTLESQISQYNNLLLIRNNLAASSSANNPIVVDYDNQLKGQREAILKAMTTQVASLKATLANIEGAKGEIKSSLASGPNQAKHLLSAERQQKVKESLYLYLLQKREENELTQTFTADNTRIITPPYGPLKPVSPKKSLILMVAFIFGFAFPAVMIYMIAVNDTKVRSRKDLERMATPFSGEIPFLGKKTLADRFPFLKRKNKKRSAKDNEQVLLAVSPGSRDVASEAFRIVRGNIDFMMNQNREENSNIILVTSFNPGSGKSFITFNLAASFALKGKRVLNIDCDLRHGSTSQFVGMPSKGLSNYLTGQSDDWKQYVKKYEGFDDFDVLPIGHRPPNPSELLENGRLATLLAEAGKEYDYVFLDCPPVDVVVDTQIIEKYVGRTIFIVRAGLLEKDAVAEIDTIYRQKRFRHMSVLLNGTEAENSRYGNYGGGYYHQDLD